jgi:hypothetical protein
MASKKENIIIIEGLELTEKKYPVLYKWAKHNPESLARTLRKNAQVHGGTIPAVAIGLENDLERTC